MASAMALVSAGKNAASEDEIYQASPQIAKLLKSEFHALLVALAKVRCRKAVPLCVGCPLREVCRHGRAR